MKIQKPKPLLKKNIKIDVKTISTSIGKGAANLALGQWDALSDNSVDILASLGLNSGPEELGWLLLYRAYLRAAKQTTEEILRDKIDSTDIRKLQESISAGMATEDFVIDSSFFSNPRNAKTSIDVAKQIESWIKIQGFDATNAKTTSMRFLSYVSAALHDEWASKNAEYQAIRTAIDTPFTQANEMDFGWLHYATHISKQIDDPVFTDIFSLRQIYIPLRGYFLASERSALDSRNTSDEDQPAKRKVTVDLLEHVLQWIKDEVRSDPIRLISGGPGSGKSSFAKILAAEIHENLNLKVLFIPMHHFDHHGDLMDSIGKFLQNQGFLPKNPLDVDQGEGRIIVIFDGLDELSLQGKLGERAAFDFLREVIRKAEQLNHSKLRVQFCITGREVVIQSSETLFRREGQTIHVLPYYIPKNERSRNAYIDEKKLLARDQRDEWWRKYGTLLNQEFDGMPKELGKGKLNEVTAQPLLNYLVALAFRHGKLKLTGDTNLNLVYADLLREVYERGWSGGSHASTQGLSHADFNRILEEVALCTWHGDGRKTTIREIERVCSANGISGILEKFQAGIESDSKAKVTQLLAAFYFRQNGTNNSGDRTFEFTHKSFGEYLTARRIVRELSLTTKRTNAHAADPDEGWSPKNACTRLIGLLGSTEIDEYLYEFIIGELKTRKDEVREIQKTLIKLIEHTLKFGIPLEAISPRPDFQTERLLAKNTEASLLILLNACARCTKTVSHINWPTERSFGELLARIVGQREFDKLLILQCLGYLDLTGSVLVNRDLWTSNFEKSILRLCSLVGSDCRYTIFDGADLRGTRFSYGNFAEASFSNCRIGGVDAETISMFDMETFGEIVELGQANFSGASFDNADLRNIPISKVDLRKTDFTHTNLTGAKLYKCTLLATQENFFLSEGASLRDCNISIDDPSGDDELEDSGFGEDDSDFDEEDFFE